jgi:hypothetical protein
MSGKRKPARMEDDIPLQAIPPLTGKGIALIVRKFR